MTGKLPVFPPDREQTTAPKTCDDGRASSKTAREQEPNPACGGRGREKVGGTATVERSFGADCEPVTGSQKKRVDHCGVIRRVSSWKELLGLLGNKWSPVTRFRRGSGVRSGGLSSNAAAQSTRRDLQTIVKRVALIPKPIASTHLRWLFVMLANLQFTIVA